MPWWWRNHWLSMWLGPPAGFVRNVLWDWTKARKHGSIWFPWNNPQNPGFFFWGLYRISMKHSPGVHKFKLFSFSCHLTRGSSRLGRLSGSPPLFLFDMLLMIGGGSGTWCSLCSFALFGGSSWTWVLPFCSLFSPFLRCFGLLMIDRVVLSSKFASHFS